jgi:hypothetical protein
MRGFFMLPQIFIWGNGQCIKVITNPADANHEEEVLGLVFDSKDTAEEYLRNIGFDDLDCNELYQYDTSQLISTVFEDRVDNILINGQFQVPYDEFAKLELAFTTVN